MPIHLSELLSPRPDALWHLVKQCGVTDVVALLQGGEQDQRMLQSVGAEGYTAPLTSDPPWSKAAIQRDVEAFAADGLTVVAIEDTAPMDRVRLGHAGRDEDIDRIITQIEAMGDLGIPVLCYNWMPLTSWGRTEVDRRARGGARVTAFRATDLDALPPLAADGELVAEQLWDSLAYFLDAVVPVAENAGVRMSMHPDDPPRAMHRNVPRIMGTPDAFRRMLSMQPSPSNAITFCQGNFALMGHDLPELIREFGEQIAFVHFRDVRGVVDDFEETFHDEGQTDMAACMRAYAEIGFDGPMRPDHVPTMHGEGNEHPAYGTLGRLFALGYIRGLEHATRGMG